MSNMRATFLKCVKHRAPLLRTRNVARMFDIGEHKTSSS